MKAISGAVALLCLLAFSRAAAAQGPASQAPLPNSSGAAPPRRSLPTFSAPTGADPSFDSVQRARDGEQTGPLDAEEQAVLARGEISMNAQIGGGVAAALVGGGLGQAIEGRWSRTGWIFTIGEPVLLGTGLIALGQCPETRCSGAPRAVATAALVGYSAMRLWGFFDALLAPRAHNQRVRALRERAKPRKVVDPFADEYSQSRVIPYVAPSAVGQGATAGLLMRF